MKKLDRVDNTESVSDVKEYDAEEKVINDNITNINKSISDNSKVIKKAEVEDKLKEIKEQFISDKRNLKVMNAFKNIKDKVVSTLIE